MRDSLADRHSLADRGRLSMSAVFERVRFSVAVAEFKDTDLDGFKLNNNFRAYYGRLFRALHPELAKRCVVRSLGHAQQPMGADDVRGEL